MAAENSDDQRLRQVLQPHEVLELFGGMRAVHIKDLPLLEQALKDEPGAGVVVDELLRAATFFDTQTGKLGVFQRDRKPGRTKCGYEQYMGPQVTAFDLQKIGPVGPYRVRTMFTEATTGWHTVSRAVYQVLDDHGEPVFNAALLGDPTVSTTSSLVFELDHADCVEYYERLLNRKVGKAFAEDCAHMTKCIPQTAYGWPERYKILRLPKALTKHRFSLVPAMLFLYGVWWWTFLAWLRAPRTRQPDADAMDTRPTAEVPPAHPAAVESSGDETDASDADWDLTSDDDPTWVRQEPPRRHPRARAFG